jgi:hypothetical protein
VREGVNLSKFNTPKPAPRIPTGLFFPHSTTKDTEEKLKNLCKPHVSVKNFHVLAIILIIRFLERITKPQNHRISQNQQNRILLMITLKPLSILLKMMARFFNHKNTKERRRGKKTDLLPYFRPSALPRFRD